MRINYESTKSEISTGDVHLYLLWAPIGKLAAGEYTLELYDTAAKKVTASRKCQVLP